MSVRSLKASVLKLDGFFVVNADVDVFRLGEWVQLGDGLMQ
jgi:hypothetical protein